MQKIRFLDIDEVILVNKSQIQLFGGLHGIRDKGLLESAVYDVQASFGGRYLYKDIYHMAAGYAYNIIKNHPFIDGNKRTGIVCCLIFLHFNDIEIEFAQEELYKLGIAIATSKIDIDKIAVVFKKKVKMH